MENKKKVGIVAIAIIFVIVAGLSMGCIGEDTGEMDILTEQIKALEEKIEQAKEDAKEEAYLTAIEELKEEIAALKEEADKPVVYTLVTVTTEDFNETFSAYGRCGCAEWHIKAKALERAKDKADTLGTYDDVTDIVVKYTGREREFLGNDSECWIRYFYRVTWIVSNTTEEVVVMY